MGDAVPESVVVMGRRWQDSDGNTYHSVRVIIDTAVELVEPYAYGYDNQFEETALELCEAWGILRADRYANGSRETLSRACYRLGAVMVRDVVDVARRRDLHRGGRGGLYGGDYRGF